MLTAPPRTRKRHALAGRFMVVLLACLGFAAGAVGQGTSGMVPDPITTSELTEYAARLHLSDQQWQALEAQHDQYKVQFRALREGEIADLMRSISDMQTGGAFPTREVMEKFIENMGKVNDRVAALDRRFFDGLEPVLAEEQLVELPRVRRARARKRLAQPAMLQLVGGGVTDLGAIVTPLSLAPPERARADAILVPYEMRLTSEMTTLADASMNLWLNLLDGLTARGFDENAATDPEQAQKMMQAVEEVYAEVSAPITKIIVDLSDLNRRAYRSLRPALSPEHAREVRRQFLRAAYPLVGGMVYVDADTFRRVLRDVTLTEPERQVIDGLLATLESGLDHLTDQGMDLADQLRPMQTPFGGPDGEDAEKVGRKIGELRDDAQQRVRRTGEQIATLLGNERYLEAARAARDDIDLKALAMTLPASDVAAATQPDAAVEAPPSPVEVEAARLEHYVAGPISVRDFEQYAARLALDEGERAVATELHGRYRESFRARRPEFLDPLQKAQQSMWRFDAKTGRKDGPTRAQVDEIDRLRRAAVRAVQTLDDELFADLHVALAADDENRQRTLARLRDQRRRDMYRVPTTAAMSYDPYGGNEPLIDLVLLLDELNPGDDVQAAIDESLAAYEKELTGVLAARFDAALAGQVAMDRWTSAWMERQSRGEETLPADWNEMYRSIVGDAASNASKFNDQVVELNKRHLAVLAEQLPAEVAAALHEKYRHRAYPSIFSESDGVERQLAQALALPDLTDTQRRTLRDLATEYRPSMAALTDNLVEVVRSVPRMNWLEQGKDFDWREYQRLQSKIERVQFERSELNERAAAKLRRVLTPEQAGRIGLEDAKKN